MDTHADAGIVAEGVSRAFGPVHAVRDASFEARPGEVTALIGPNGAGKTTLMLLLATLLRPDAGRLRVAGHDPVEEPAAVRAVLGWMPDVLGSWASLTCRETLRTTGQLYGLPRPDAEARADELLARFDLVEAARRPVKQYSGGMRRRLDLAGALVAQPEVLFLDEPTTGLDPRSRNQVWDIIRALKAGGTTVLLCTQYLDEADQLTDGIAVIDHGQVIAEGTPGQLKASVGSGALHVRLLNPAQRAEAQAILARELGSVQLEPDPSALSAPCADADKGALAVAELAQNNISLADFTLGQPSLDEVFLALTGHTAEDQTITDAGEQAA